MTRGAFVNDECLILDLPVAFSVVVRLACLFVCISPSSGTPQTSAVLLHEVVCDVGLLSRA